MKEIINDIKIGASSPFEILHISDIHLTYADKRDDKRKIRLSGRRQKDFPTAQSDLDEICSIAGRENKIIINTGDLIDFVSEKNLDCVRKYTRSHDIYTCAGNHEFSLYVGEAREDEAYRNQSLEKVQAAYTNDIRFCSRIINGVNFVALDNSYYLVEDRQLEALKKETGKDYPIVLMVHTPLYTPVLFDHIMNTLHHGDAALMAVPNELMKDYSDHRFCQQKGDEVTREAYEFIKGSEKIRLILTGHLHFDYETNLRADLPQLVTGVGSFRRVRFS